MNTLSRRAVLAGGALLVPGTVTATVAGCSARTPEAEPPPAPDPEDVLLGQLISDKQRTIALYTQMVDSGGSALRPFLDRHQVHLAELRRRRPLDLPTEAPTATPPTPSTPAAEPKVTLTRLRDVERKAAALRLRQLADASPSLAQLIASIGACEAAHALALPRSL
ncbi:hypothetical protein [Nonomuraea sp. NPDC050310]|uniref:hypothetical protein n=1 Tax=unclassified Nonomuraea TaxID=2593643 RepID=UPI0033DA5FC2